MSMSAVLKEAKLMQYNIEFCGMGLVPTVLHPDADVARAFCHERRWKNETSGCEALLAAGGTGEGKLQSEAG